MLQEREVTQGRRRGQCQGVRGRASGAEGGKDVVLPARTAIFLSWQGDVSLLHGVQTVGRGVG